MIYKKNYIYALSVALTFMIQFTCYPGIILSKELSFFKDFAWFSISVITYHNLGDTIGRFLAGAYELIPKKLYPWICALRFIFVVFYSL